MANHAHRIVLIDPSPGRDELARRLQAQDYDVEIAADGAAGAELALSSPPAAIISDLWMPGVSGVQLCRLIRSEPATCDVPFILRGESDDRRDRFWAERAGAVAYVPRGRLSELVRALDKAIAARKASEDFFMQLAEGNLDIRDRIARHLDRALFESVIAAEVRSLATSESVERLIDRFSQFFSQVCTYRWLALTTSVPGSTGQVRHVGIHHAPGSRDAATREATAALGFPDSVEVVYFEDEDAAIAAPDHAPVIRPVLFGGRPVGRIAIAPGVEPIDEALVTLVARELSGPLQLTTLVEDSRRLADTDTLTGLANRRSYTAAMRVEIARCDRHGYPLVFLLLDVDHFKLINDQRGHAAGDRVLAALGGLLTRELRIGDVVARWGGEEFVISLTSTDVTGGLVTAERIRRAVEGLEVRSDAGDNIPITVSIGIAAHDKGESLDAGLERADQAMYRAKAGGRNRAVLAGSPQPSEPQELASAPLLRALAS